MHNSPIKRKQTTCVISVNNTIKGKKEKNRYLFETSNTFQPCFEALNIYLNINRSLLRLPKGSLMQCTAEVLLASVDIVSTFTHTQYTRNGCSETNVISPSSASSSLSSSVSFSVCIPSNIEHYEIIQHSLPVITHITGASKPV